MPPKRANSQFEDERRQYQREYQREYRCRQKQNMDDTNREKQCVLYNEKEIERDMLEKEKT